MRRKNIDCLLMPVGVQVLATFPNIGVHAFPSLLRDIGLNALHRRTWGEEKAVTCFFWIELSQYSNTVGVRG